MSPIFSSGEPGPQLTWTAMVYTHSWYRPGLEPISASAAIDLPWMASNLARGETVCFERIDDLPEEAAREREVARRFGLLSNVSFPLKSGHR